MQRVFYVDEKLKKKNLREWVKTQNGYKIRHAVSIVLKILAGVVFAAFALPCICLTYGTDAFKDGLLVGILGGFGFGCIPFFIGQSVGIKAVLKCGKPYSIHTRESVVIADEGIQYSYHDTESSWETSVCVYQILREDVRVIAVNEEKHTAVIVGKGSLTVYDDIEAKRINVRLSERRFHEESQMPILLVFQNNDELIRLLKEYVKRN